MLQSRLAVLFVAVLLARNAATAESPSVTVRSLRVPGDGLQPQAVTDEKGSVHLVYFKGDPQHGDLFYVRSSDGCRTFSAPIRVNSQPGAAIAIGTVRGAHVAIGRNGRPHVTWMGAQGAEPTGPGKSAPMLYARLSADGQSFEPQRNVIREHPGLDGGGSVAADADGNVYVAWHAPGDREGEDSRQVWFTRSIDDGDTFEPERSTLPSPTGVCGCCGMRIVAGSDGRLFVTYRSATKAIHRDVHVLCSDDGGRTFRDVLADPWTIGQCVMSTAAASSTVRGTVIAWETTEQIRFARFAPDGSELGKPTSVPGPAKGRKHPAVAADAAGRFVVAWAEGTGWNRCGAVAWQGFDPDGMPIEGISGRAEGLPAWSLPAVVTGEGGFVVLY